MRNLDLNPDCPRFNPEIITWNQRSRKQPFQWRRKKYHSNTIYSKSRQLSCSPLKLKDQRSNMIPWWPTVPSTRRKRLMKSTIFLLDLPRYDSCLGRDPFPNWLESQRGRETLRVVWEGWGLATPYFLFSHSLKTGRSPYILSNSK